MSALGIEVVYQDLALCDNLDIVENMFLGRELKSRGMLDEARMETMARDALTSLSVRTVKSVRQPVSSLSGGTTSDGGDREIGAVEQQGRPARRAHRRARGSRRPVR